MTSFENWEQWRFVEYDVTLERGREHGGDPVRPRHRLLPPQLRRDPGRRDRSRPVPRDDARARLHQPVRRDVRVVRRMAQGRRRRLRPPDRLHDPEHPRPWRHLVHAAAAGAVHARAGLAPQRLQRRLGRLPGVEQPRRRRPGRWLPDPDRRRHRSDRADRRHQEGRQLRGALAGALRPVGQWNTYTIELTRLAARGLPQRHPRQLAGPHRDGAVERVHRSREPQLPRPGRLQERSSSGPTSRSAQLAAPFSRATLADGTTDNPGGESTLGNLVGRDPPVGDAGTGIGGAQIAFVQPGASGCGPARQPRRLPGDGHLHRRRPARSRPRDPGQPAAHRRAAQDRARAAVAANRRRCRARAARSCASAPRPGSPTPTTRPGRRARGSPACGSTVRRSSRRPATRSRSTRSLASGGDNFRVFADGTSRQDTGKLGAAALVDYLAAADRATARSHPAPPSTRWASRSRAGRGVVRRRRGLRRRPDVAGLLGGGGPEGHRRGT